MTFNSAFSTHDILISNQHQANNLNSQNLLASPRRLNPARLFSIFHVCLQLLLASLVVSIVVAEILVGMLFILWMLLMFSGVRYRRTGLDIPLLAFVGVRLLSIAFSEYPSLSYVTITRELVYYVSFFFTVFYLQNVSKDKIYTLLKFLFAVTVLVTLIAIIQFLLGYTQKVNALTGGGMLSTHLSLLILVALVAKSNKNIFPISIAFWLTLLVFITGLAFSMTRGDWIAASVGIFIYGFVFNRRLLLSMIIVALVIVLLLPSVRSRLVTLSNPLQNTSDRLTLWKNAAQSAGVHPILGFGPETFRVVFKDVEHLDDKYIGAWHNDVIQLYMESGIAGVASFFVVIGYLFWYSIKLIRHGNYNENDINVGWMGMLVLVAYLISGIFTMPTVSITNGILFRFLIALVAVEHQRVIEHNIG